MKHTATISITNNDGDENPYTFVIQGKGVAAPEPEMAVLGNNSEITHGSLTPSVANQTDFGNTIASSGAVTHTFTIANNGTATLHLTGAPAVALTGPGAAQFSVAQQPSSPLEAGNTTTFDIKFAPAATGLYTATLSIANNDSDESPYTFVIQGKGVATPEPEMAVLGYNSEISNGSLIPSTANQTDFGNTITPGGAATRSFTIANNGTAALQLTGVPAVALTGPGAAQFSVTQQPPSPLEAGNTTTFKIRFAPTATGTHTATVSIANNDTDENPYTFVIQGTGSSNLYLYLPLIFKN